MYNHVINDLCTEKILRSACTVATHSCHFFNLQAYEVTLGTFMGHVTIVKRRIQKENSTLKEPVDEIGRLFDNNSVINEQHHEKTCFLHMQKLRHTSVVQISEQLISAFDSTIPLICKSKISGLYRSSMVV